MIAKDMLPIEPCHFEVWFLHSLVSIAESGYVLSHPHSSRSMGYRALTKDKEWQKAVTVVVGKEKRVFLVDPLILQENPFRVLMDSSMKKDPRDHRVLFVDVDAILFEHMLWLMHNDCSSLFNLNLKEIIDFYAQDI
ncbi:hypothetical protein RJT34_30898 [Clitoria ternatea]|uniref:Uncharacterized protein n=1 Tax=Clitoria ternatea TaxID=43366 RepID=A0AAN9EXS8_CLITE